jgi:type IV fimbrial biogenesis protein FimT
MLTVRYQPHKTSGFSLFEVLITITIVALLLGLGVPSYNKFVVQKRLRLVSEDFYNYMKIAQSQSQNKQQNFYLSLKTGANWCYGLSDLANCDCSVANSCTVDGIQTIKSPLDYSGQAPTLVTTGFTGGASTPYILFDGKRGTANASGSAGFSLSGLSTTINVNKQGLGVICSNTVSGYSSCSP